MRTLKRLLCFFVMAVAIVYVFKIWGPEHIKVPESTAGKTAEASSTGESSTAQRKIEVSEGKIISIADGDTITVDLNGEKQKVRMLEVDTPESVHYDSSKNTVFGKEASEYTKSHLKIGQTVYLSKDSSEKDKYGRLLRLVWTERPESDSEEELRSKCYNARLLLDGYALVAIFDDRKYEKVFRKFEEEAESAQTGLWSDKSWKEYVNSKTENGSKKTGERDEKYIFRLRRDACRVENQCKTGRTAA